MAKKSIKRTILCDTNIFIEVFKQNTTIVNAYAKIGEDNVAVNPIIKAELYRGAQNKEQFLAIKGEIKKLQNFRLDLQTSKKFEELMARYALSHRPAVADMLIAATSLVNSLPLYTLNTADFDFIKGINLYTP